MALNTSTETAGSFLAKSVLAAEFTVREGDRVETLDGANLGRIRSVRDVVIEILGPLGIFWIDRDDIFWADDRGVVLALGLDELAARNARSSARNGKQVPA